MPKQRSFKREFEEEAVRLTHKSGPTRRAVADDLEIGLSMVTRWLGRAKDLATGDPGADA